jgi:hypothetical protein
MKKPLRSSARGASFDTKHATNVNVFRVVLLDANSYLAYRRHVKPLAPAVFTVVALTNSQWARVVGYGPFSFCVIHKEVGTLIGR